MKARLIKFDGGGDTEGRQREDLDSTIKQVIDKALVSDTVVDIYDAAGIKKPDISILSEEFLMEVRQMRQKTLPWRCCTSFSTTNCTVVHGVISFKAESFWNFWKIRSGVTIIKPFRLQR